jgi:AcrR family transcriptional regulator
MSNMRGAVRPPKQERSRASFERVLLAARKLLEEEGYPSFTVARVSERAGVSVGSIYARVPSKDALFHAVHARVMEEIHEHYEAIAQEESRSSRNDLPTRELIIETIRVFAQPFRKHTAFLRVVMHRGAVDEVVAAFGSEVSSNQADQFRAVVLTRRDEVTHADPELAVDVAYRMVYCTIARQVMYGPTFESQRAIAWDDLVRELGDAAATYLLGSRG